MKLSEYTKKLLKNIAEINGSLVINPSNSTSEGTVIKSINKEKSMQLIAVVPEKFENFVCLYDLNSFLAVQSAMGDDEVNFGEKFVTVEDKNSKVTMGYADPMLVIHEEREMKFPEGSNNVVFELSEEQLGKLLKFADILGLPHLRLFKKDGALVFQATHMENTTSNTYNVTINENWDQDFPEVFFVRELIKIIPGSYRVEVSSRMAKFTNQVGHMVYNIGTKTKA